MSATKKAVAKVDTQVAPKTVALSEKGRAAIDLFNKAKYLAEQAKEIKAEAEAVLRGELGESVEATWGGVVVVKVVGGKNTSFDREMLENVYPEAYSATIRATHYDYLKTL